MFKCPVCRHATFTPFQYTAKPAFTGSVVCSNCKTELHQPSRWVNAVVVLPYVVIFWPLSHFHVFTSAAHEFFGLGLCAIISFGLAVAVTKLEPTDPHIALGSKA